MPHGHPAAQAQQGNISQSRPHLAQGPLLGRLSTIGSRLCPLPATIAPKSEKSCRIRPCTALFTSRSQAFLLPWKQALTAGWTNGTPRVFCTKAAPSQRSYAILKNSDIHSHPGGGKCALRRCLTSKVTLWQLHHLRNFTDEVPAAWTWGELHRWHPMQRSPATCTASVAVYA